MRTTRRFDPLPLPTTRVAATSTQKLPPPGSEPENTTTAPPSTFRPGPPKPAVAAHASFADLIASGVVTKGTRTANGWEQTFYEAGPKDGPVVMVLHGFPGTPAFAARMLPDLIEAGYRVVMPELRWLTPLASFAGSPDRSAVIDGDPDYDLKQSSLGGDVRNLVRAARKGSTHYGLDSIAKDVEALAATFTDAKVRLVTHDFGSLIGYQIDPSKVESFVTMAIPHPGATLPTQPLRVDIGGHRVPLPLPPLDVAFSARHFLSIPAHLSNDYLLQHLDGWVDRWGGGFKPDLTDFEQRLADPMVRVAVRQLYADYGVNSGIDTLRDAVGLSERLQMYKPTSVPTLAFAGVRDGATTLGSFTDSKAFHDGPYEVRQVDTGHFIAEETDVGAQVVEFLSAHREQQGGTAKTDAPLVEQWL